MGTCICAAPPKTSAKEEGRSGAHQGILRCSCQKIIHSKRCITMRNNVLRFRHVQISRRNLSKVVRKQCADSKITRLATDTMLKLGPRFTFVSICTSPLFSTERTAPCAFNHFLHSSSPSAPLASQTSSTNPKTCVAYLTGIVGRYDFDMHFIASKRIRSAYRSVIQQHNRMTY